MRRQLGALAVLFLAAHLLVLPPALEDIDSINFALAVRDFDVARHQPHPPGYPVFVALSKLSTALAEAAGVPGAPSRALAALSALSGAALVLLLAAFYRELTGDPRLAWWSMAVAVCSPLFWFTALRPLSDMTGLALSVAAQLLLLRALPLADREGAAPDRNAGSRRRRWLIAGALMAGVAAGIRVQTAMLTLPLLAAALVWPSSGVPLRVRALGGGAAAAGVLMWAVPLLAASGGLSGYLAALGTQAGEDFAGVVMLWTRPEPRVALNAALYSFVWPWGSLACGAGVLLLAAAGAVRLMLRARTALLLLGLAFAPYAAFHLLFHETVTMRYALPLVVPVALLACSATAGSRVLLPAAALVLCVISLYQAVPAARSYGRTESPAFAAFREAAHASGGPGAVLGLHAVMRRVEEWHRPTHGVRVLPAVHGREPFALVEHWRANPRTPVTFLADPRRTDLALFDPRARREVASHAWPLPEVPFLAGIRPSGAQVHAMDPPGWMLDRGWALTAEVGGVTARTGLGPHVREAVAWVRARPEGAMVLVGGRHLGAAGAPAMRLELSGQGGPLARWDVAPGFFFRPLALAAGVLGGDGYVPLSVRAAPTGAAGRTSPVSLEQFDLQGDGVPMVGFVDGWQEPEYDPETGRAWRWMSERAALWVRGVGRDVTLSLRGESPLRYFDAAPRVHVKAGGRDIAWFEPSSDFAQDVVVPASTLGTGGGIVVIESSRWFTPAERGESPDQRHLALRMFSVSVR